MNILIIGAGDIGFQLSKQLSRQKHDITMIEADQQKMMRASEQLDAIVIAGNGGSYRTLEEAQLQKMGIVAAMTDRDEVNLMACRLAKRSGVPTTIARVRHPQYTTPDFILSPDELGTDLIIHPEKETADAVLHLIHQSCAAYAIELDNGKIDVLGVHLEQNSPLLDIPLMDLIQKYGDPPMRIVAIDRNYHTIIPGGDDKLIYGDEVFVICDPEYTPTFISLAGKKDRPMRNVMILGGGLIGQFIATSLAPKANVKIVETDMEKAQKLADSIPRALIINGDGTDFDLLESEGLNDMDAFVAVTGNDEVNIITTLLAQHANVPRSIALVNKREYISIAPKLGVDATVSKQSLAVNSVRRYIQQQQVATIANIPSGDTQIIEYITQAGCKITRQPLKDINFPDNAIMGGILRNDKLIIPKGDTQVQAEDKVVIFTLPQTMSKVDKLFSQERSLISQILPL
ncbi:Trk system potassium transporter TrkA [Anaerolineales bacterium HSG6]|nr:Trk system potassium transporter TrkA [Anaerolineales bacterium HSG6]MDM8531764.1 Trk system potassium transporter TrkA [Anaerolineales bacterium HSG25]